MLASAILVFYIEKHGQTYPLSLKQHGICTVCAWVMFVCISDKPDKLPPTSRFFLADTVYEDLS